MCLPYRFSPTFKTVSLLLSFPQPSRNTFYSFPLPLNRFLLPSLFLAILYSELILSSTQLFTSSLFSLFLSLVQLFTYIPSSCLPFSFLHISSYLPFLNITYPVLTPSSFLPPPLPPKHTQYWSAGHHGLNNSSQKKKKINFRSSFYYTLLDKRAAFPASM